MKLNNVMHVVDTAVRKYVPTGRGRGRPRVSKVIARDNHKINEFLQRRPQAA